LTQDFYRKSMGQGVELFVCPTQKFKTIVVQVFLHQQLERGLATSTSLFPMVLMRGSSTLPTQLEITRKLEALYGAGIENDILKKGERQIVTFALEVVNEKFTPGNQEVLRDALEVLRDVMYSPLLEGEGFSKNYVDQEKEQLKTQISGLINDKMSLATERCVQEMCAKERYGTFKYGYLEEVDPIDPAALLHSYRTFMKGAPLDFFVVGDVQVEKIQSLVEEVFTFPKGEKFAIEPPKLQGAPAEPRVVEEKMNVKQGKLTLGYRTNVPYGDDTFPLLFYSGILGGFSHSKLFQNVREKAGLAYYVFSRLEKSKGLMLISSGIEVENYNKALEIIHEQVHNMAAGEITDFEFDNTRKGLLSQATLVEDNPYQLVGSTLEGVINQSLMSRREAMERLAAVSKEDVARIARGVELDTIYFLRN
jgi:predicted Zn-dependent peptidase